MNSPADETGRSIALIGSGPAACYLAQALLRQLPGCRIVVFDRLPAPYGLLRYGVAADHQGTKAVSRQFDRLFEREGVRFAGGITVGADISLDVLRSAFDAVVLCTGLHADYALGIPGDSLDGVVGSGRLTRALNGHPGDGLEFRAGRRSVVVGAGNVAIDVVRLLAKTSAQLEGSDADDALLGRITAGLNTIEVISRSSVARAKFDLAMVRELGTLPDVCVEVREASSPPTGDEEAFSTDDTLDDRGSVLRELAARDVPSPRVTISFRFGVVPVQIEGDTAVRGVRVAPADGSGEADEIPADSVITAIGFRQSPDDPLRRERLIEHGAAPEAGRLGPGLYCAGWLRTGPRGTIPSHRDEGKALAEMIAADFTGALASPRPGWESLAEEVRCAAVDWAGWLRIDQHERASAPVGRVRAKVTDNNHMFALARDELKTLEETA